MASVGWRCVLVAGALLARPMPAAAETYVLPSSSFRSGANGAEYRTDVRILNAGTAAVTVSATFYDQAAATTLGASPFRVEARNQAAFDNVLQSMFGRSLGDGAYGPIRFESTGPILITASVSNVNACGTGAVSGQRLPGIAASRALAAGVIGQLAVSASPASGYRTNLVFMNPGSVPATAAVNVRRGRGALLSSATIGPLPANGFLQVALNGAEFPGVSGTTDRNLWLEFTSDQPILVYATVIHNVSGDPFAVLPSRDAPPPEEATKITSFTASPANIAPGQPVTLSWTSTGGTSAGMDNGIGGVPLDGSLEVFPAGTTTYWLTVEGPAGSKVAAATVTVGAPYSEVTFQLPGGVPLVLVKIPAGTFQMGSPAQERGRGDGETRHQVTLTRDYYIGKYEVTKAQWQAVMGFPVPKCGGILTGDGGYPASCVSWESIHAPDGFLARLNQLLGTSTFRLPTEAEWERAARGGSTTRFSFGNALAGDDACGENPEAGPYAWWCRNSSWSLQPVGEKAPNPYGLYDVHGNVAEWVEDWEGPYPATLQVDPTGPPDGTRRVLRGGSVPRDLSSARSASRNADNPRGYSASDGFRLAWSP